MNSLPPIESERLVAALVKGAALELYLTPKPGLVDLLDNGSHPDLSLPLMERSILYLADYLGELNCSLRKGEAFSRQIEIGKRAEQAMFQSLGTNTHNGYLFLSGLVLVAGHHTPSRREEALRRTIASLADEFFAGEDREKTTNGGEVRRRFQAGGVVREALDGFPSLFEEAVPAYRATVAGGGGFRRASFAMLARLMQTVEDTTTLRRGGRVGLERIRRDGRELEQTVGDDAASIRLLLRLNREYTRDNLTMGGVADMLGLAYGYLLAQW